MKINNKTGLFKNANFGIAVMVILSLLLVWLVWVRTSPSSPIIFRKNDWGINLLGERNSIWEIPFISLLFIGLNYYLAQSVFRNRKGLKRLLLSVNIGIAILLLLISMQLYWLNL